MANPNDLLVLADTEVHYLDSAIVGDEYKIFVGHCPSPRQTAKGCAVLFLTDANGYFGSAVDMIRGMQLDRHLPPLLVVGIGYRRAGIADTLDLRTRDLTPTADPLFSERFGNGAETGGAWKFLSFIREELEPWVQERFAITPGDTTYFGHSFGGLMGVYTLLTEPRTFKNYIIGSPSLWWGEDWSFGFEEAYARSHSDLCAQTYFAVGSEETHDGRQRESRNMPEAQRAMASARYIDMVADTERFVAALRARQYAGLSIAADVFASEFHITVPSLILSRGLRHVFDAPR